MKTEEEKIEKLYNEYVISDKFKEEYFECFKAGFEKSLFVKDEQVWKMFQEGKIQSMVVEKLMADRTAEILELIEKMESKSGFLIDARELRQKIEAMEKGGVN